MKKEVAIKEHIILILCENEFAMCEKTPNEKGLQLVTFSIPITSKDVDLLDQSGIIEAVNFKPTGKLVFRRKAFFETHLLIDLIIDLLEKHANAKS